MTRSGPFYNRLSILVILVFVIKLMNNPALVVGDGETDENVFDSFKRKTSNLLPNCENHNAGDDGDVR